jgi:hypothetical protein
VARYFVSFCRSTQEQIHGACSCSCASSTSLWYIIHVRDPSTPKRLSLTKQTSLLLLSGVSTLATLAALLSRASTLLRRLIWVLLHLLLALLLALPLELPDLLRRRVLNEITLVVDTAPLGQTIWDIHYTLAVEHVAAGLEVRLVLVGLEVNERREEQDHVAALVHDGAVAVRAAHFTGQLMLDALLGGVVPFEVVVAVSEVNVILVEDGGPLEGSS